MVTPRRLNLSGDEIQALVAFLETLTDEVLIADVKFSDPFREVFDIIAQIFLPIGLNE